MAREIVKEKLSLSTDSSSELRDTAQRLGCTEDTALSQAVDLLSIALRARSAGLRLVFKTV